MNQIKKTELELIKKLDSLSIREEDKRSLIDFIRPIIQDRQERMDFLHNRTTKDKTIAINLLNQAIADLENKQEQIQQANQTLREQKEMLEMQSQQLRENLEQLEMSYREVEQFSYIASHDLRSPLRTIASYAQLLQRRYHHLLDDDADDFLNFIVSGAIQMNEILKDLLAYSRVGEPEELFTNTNLNRVIDIVRFNLHTEIQEQQAQIDTEPLPEIHASKSGMLHLFQNLIGNAIKFRSEQRPHIQISARHNRRHWHFSVADNGVGLDETLHHKAFLPFQRLNDRSLPGSGIGLAICNKIVKLHKGRIWYERRPGGGTVFHFTLAHFDPR